MKGYALVEEVTNEVKTLMTWGEQEIAEDFPVNEGYYILEVEEKVFQRASDRLPLLKKLTVNNPNALVYSEVFTEGETRDLSHEQEVVDLKAYLASTDFYFIRRLDSGKEIPPEVQDKRDHARQRLLELGL